MPDNHFYPLTIAQVRPETKAAICVTFAVPDELRAVFRFIQGQFLTLNATIDGAAVQRAYSICSSACGQPLRVGIKRVRNGGFSNYANDNFKPGDVVDVMPPQGRFHTPLDPAQRKKYMFIAAGSGITPILSHIATVLAVEPGSRATLIYGNQSSASMMFKESLCFLKNRYLDRFQWINIMAQEDQGSDLFNGIIDNAKGYALARAGLIDIRATDEAFICGPEAMMSEVSRGFRLEGLQDRQIHFELFANSSSDAQRVLEKAQQRIDTYGETRTSTVTLISDGRTVSFPLASVGGNILDAGLAHGLELPYSCKAGVCSTCKARLTAGEVDMDITHGLEPRERRAGYILTCQAHPVSARVTVDFDQR